MSPAASTWDARARAAPGSHRRTWAQVLSAGSWWVTPLPRKPNYSFERRQRQTAKAAKRDAKKEAKSAAKGQPPSDEAGVEADVEAVDGSVTVTPENPRESDEA